jgi:hypothetical protein
VSFSIAGLVSPTTAKKRRETVPPEEVTPPVGIIASGFTTDPASGVEEPHVAGGDWQ